MMVSPIILSQVDTIIEMITDSVAWSWWQTVWGGVQPPVNRAWRGQENPHDMEVGKVLFDDMRTYARLFEKVKVDHLQCVEEAR